MDERFLYDEVVVARSRAPRLSGVAEHATAHASGKNPLCGDRVRLSLCIDEGAVTEIRHETRGCAICTASADLMAEEVTGLPAQDALELSARFTDMLEMKPEETHPEGPFGVPEALNVFLPLKTHRSRIRCATLPWSVLGEALSHD